MTSPPSFTQAELDHLCRGPRPRLVEAHATGSADEIERTFRRITGFIADIANLYSRWTAGTVNWLQVRHGFEAAAAVCPPGELLPGGPECGLTEAETTLVRAVLRADRHPEPAAALAARLRATATSPAPDALLQLWHEVHAALDRAEILRRDTATALVSHVHDVYGPDGLEDCYRHLTELIWLPRMRSDLQHPPTARLRNWAEKMSIGHNGQVSIREEPDRWVFTLNPCGSCGRQLLAGRYQPPWNFAVVEANARVGFLREDITVYQAHLAVAHTMVPIELTGAPWPAMSCVGLAAQPCELVLYRDPARTDEGYYAQVGAAKA